MGEFSLRVCFEWVWCRLGNKSATSSDHGLWSKFPPRSLLRKWICWGLQQNWKHNIFLPIRWGNFLSEYVSDAFGPASENIRRPHPITFWYHSSPWKNKKLWYEFGFAAKFKNIRSFWQFGRGIQIGLNASNTSCTILIGLRVGPNLKFRNRFYPFKSVKIGIASQFLSLISIISRTGP